MIETIDPTTTFTLGGSALAGTGLIWWLQRFLRSVRRESVEGVKDRAEIALFERLSNENIALREQNAELLRRAQLERERADIFARERNEAQNELGALRSEAGFLRIQVEQMQAQIMRMEDRLRGIGGQ